MAYEKKLEELSLFMGEVFKDEEARKELFELANADAYEEDISYSLKKLLSTNENPVSRKRSAIVNAFYKNAENHRVKGEGFDEKELIEFINKNEIGMLAPYMIGYFDPKSISELTVSWWTEEMEEESIKNDPNGEGETPGYKLKLNDKGNFISFGKENKNIVSNLIFANDEYAEKNPTVVFGRFDVENAIYLAEQDSRNFATLNENANINSPICNDLDENDIIVVRMPEFQLRGNIRRWPNHNYMHIWVATGSFELGSNGLPKITSDVNYPISDRRVTRRQARNNTWMSSGASFIISNWKLDSDNAYIVWACKRTQANIDVEGTVKASKKDGPSAQLKVKVAVKSSVELVSAMSYDKCFVMLNNRNRTQQGNIPLRHTFPVYEFSQVRSYFTLEKL